MSTVRKLMPGKRTKGAVPVRRVERPLRSMEEFFENFFGRGLREPMLDWGRPFLGDMEPLFEAKPPRVDIIDDDKFFLVKAELPGVKKDELDVVVTADAVTIKVKREAREEEKEEKFYRCETTQGYLERMVTFPAAVDAEEVEAELKDGLLVIRAPKAELLEKHTIEVR